MNITAEPFDEANEADVAEQQQAADGSDDTLTPPDVSPDEASEADILEQGATVAPDDEGYPHRSEGQPDSP